MKKNIYNIFLVILSLLVSIQVQGQYAWDNLGPDNLGSRTRTLAFDATGNLLAGSQGGGLWISKNDGVSWERVTSYNGNPNITSIAVDGNTIIVGTGATAFELPYYVSTLNQSSSYDYRANPDGFKGYLTGLPGGGAYISTDNGATWAPAPGTDTPDTRDYQGPFSSIQKVEIANGQVYIATVEGLYFSLDKNVETLFKANGPQEFSEGVVYDVAAADGDVILATARKEFTDRLFISRDKGFSFTEVDDPALSSLGPFSSVRSKIAVAPTDNKVIYVAGTQPNNEISGVFRSTDNGDTWEVYGPKGSPGFTPLGSGGRSAFTLEVFPDNPNELIVAGNAWYTFSETDGWNPTATHSLPIFDNYVPNSIYSVAFDPNDPSKLFVGTDQQIVRSDDRGETFSLKSKGYEAQVSYTVASLAVTTLGEEETNLEAVITGTETNGYLFNRNFTSETPARQGFGDIFTVNFGKAAASNLTPGAILMEGTDGGPMRSFNTGTSSERFYGLPQEIGASSIDSSTSIYVDRSGINVAGGALFNRPTAAQSAWVLDEVIPEAAVSREDLTVAELQELSQEYLFLCSGSYVWVCNGVFGDGLQVKWNRITNELVDGSTEFLSAITVSGDENHTVYVGSSRGKIWRLDRANDLANFDAVDDVVRLDNTTNSNLAVMTGRGVTDLAVDPKNPDRLVITYGSYGGSVQNTQNLVWTTDSARSSDAPAFGRLTGDNLVPEPAYAAEFVQDPNSSESVLLVGTETGLLSVRDFNKVLPQLYTATVTDESGEDFGGVPVYDIYVRKYRSVITEEALSRKELRINPIPGGGFDTTEVTIERASHKLIEDNTIFIASHGLGVWSTSSILLGRKANNEEPIEIDQTAISLYPNPTQGETSVRVELAEKSQVLITMYSIDGRVIATTNNTFESGIQQINYDMSQLSSGMYFFRVDVQGEKESVSKTLKAVLAR